MGFLFLGDENVLILGVSMNVQLSEYNEDYFVHSELFTEAKK